MTNIIKHLLLLMFYISQNNIAQAKEAVDIKTLAYRYVPCLNLLIMNIDTPLNRLEGCVNHMKSPKIQRYVFFHDKETGGIFETRQASWSFSGVAIYIGVIHRMGLNGSYEIVEESVSRTEKELLNSKRFTINKEFK